MTAIRQGSSGPIASPVYSAGIDGWDLSRPISLTLAKAGHPRGVYTVGCELFVRIAALAGNFTLTTLSWDQIDFGPTSIVLAPFAPTVIGTRSNLYRSLPSSGLAPIVWNLVPASITGSPLVDASAYAELVSLAV